MQITFKKSRKLGIKRANRATLKAQKKSRFFLFYLFKKLQVANHAFFAPIGLAPYRRMRCIFRCYNQRKPSKKNVRAIKKTSGLCQAQAANCIR